LRWDPDCLTGLEPVAGVSALAVDAHLPGAQQLLQRTVAERGIMALEPAVEAQTRFVLLYARSRYHITTRTNHSPANKAPTDSTTEAII
jgi:hypothetical protein